MLGDCDEESIGCFGSGVSWTHYPPRPGDSGVASWKAWCLRGNLKDGEDYGGEVGMGWRDVLNRRTHTWVRRGLGIMQERACLYDRGSQGRAYRQENDVSCLFFVQRAARSSGRVFCMIGFAASSLCLQGRRTWRETKA